MDINYTIEVYNALPANDDSFISSNSFTKLIYAKDSPVTIKMNETVVFLNKGNSLLLPPLAKFSVSGEKMNYTYSYFSYFLFSENFYFGSPSLYIIYDEKSDISTALHRYFSLSKPFSAENELLKKSIEYYIFYITSSDLRKNGLSVPEKMLPVIEYIETNYSHNFSMNDLAKHSGMSESSIYKLFDAYLHESPKQYIIKRRMAYATALLLNSDKSISDVAIESGFYDQFYFSKEFKKIFNVSPSIYRKKIIDK